MADAKSDRFRKNNPAPEINPVIKFFITSFFTLSSERSMSSGGIGMIPVSKILEYADWLGFEDITRFLKIIQTVDSGYVDVFYKNLEAKSSSTK